MTTVAFHGRNMGQSLRSFGRANSAFLQGGQQAFEELARRLETSLNKSEREFRWGTKVGGEERPIKTIQSKRWKGAGDHRPLHAIFTFGWQCSRPDLENDRLVVRDGATEITFIDVGIDGTKAVKSFHFDLCGGGTETGSGHPMFHTQFSGSIPDIPRLPSFLMHPLDAMEWALMDCFQLEWRKHLKEARTRSTLGGYSKAQHHRVTAALRRWLDKVDADKTYPLLAFLSGVATPLELDARRDGS